MKLFGTILCFFYFNSLVAYKAHDPFTGDILTITVSGKEDCQMPGSIVRWHEVNNLKKLMEVLKADGIGTGFVYQHQNTNYVLTCDHVIGRGKEIMAYDADQNGYALEWIGADIFYDIAVLKFKKQKDALKFKPVVLETGKPHIGEIIWSVGYWNPDSSLNRILGEVQQTNFTFEEDNVVAGKMKYVESNAPLESGFSGGPAYNREGKVVGMNTKRYSGYRKAFALESETIKRVVADIIEYGGVRRTYTGIRFIQDVDTTGAVIIDAILDDSPANKFKDRLLNKMVTGINKQKVNTIFDVLHIMEGIQPNEAFFIEVQSKDMQPDKIPFSNYGLDIINKKSLEKVACYAIEEVTHKDNCVNIQEINGKVTLTLDDDKKVLPTTFGLRLNEQDYLTYCAKNLAHFGRLARLLSLYGRMEIDIDSKNEFEIHLSRQPMQRVLYF